ncbi:MAG: hypothetical protein GXX05_09260 [Firmicutes bacterium]|nr:hypothetical protein [Bacillota bacterium]
MMLPVVLTLIVAGFITVIVVISSYFSYKEKEMLVKHGVDPEGVRKIAYKEEYLEPITKLTSLRSAVTLIAVGGALTIGLGLIGVGPWLLGGLIPLFLGIGRLILYYILPDDKQEDKDENKDA